MRVEIKKLSSLLLILTSAIIFIIGANYNSSYSLEKISDLNFVLHMELMKGHNEQAIANKKIANGFLAEKHIEHSLYINFATIKNYISDFYPDLDKKFSSEFNHLRSMAKNSTESEFIQEVKNANRLINEITNTVVSSRNSTFTLLTIGKIMDTISVEYSEAVDRDGKIQDIIEYQDSLGFISRADDLINQVIDKDDILEIQIKEWKKIDNSIIIIEDKIAKKIPFNGVIDEIHNVIDMILKITNKSDEVMYS